MSKIYTLEQIKDVMDKIELSEPIAKGFVAYSNGEVVVPPVGELTFTDPPGDTHIKYGYIKGDETYVIKIASGFYNNPKLGLSSSSGLMLVFSQKTGELQTVLLDEGYLTNVRTAVAGQICAKYLAPENVTSIGVLGTGIQAGMQVEYLAPVTQCKQVFVWGRTPSNAENYKEEMTAKGYHVTVADSPAQVAQKCNLIVTTTPSTSPLLSIDDILPGTHITAMGSDTPGKQELASSILEKADIIIADSISQCRERGEIAKALVEGMLDEQRILELGTIIDSPALVKRTKESISVADLTGVAVQDVQIATAVCNAFA